MNYEFQVLQAFDHHKDLIREFENERMVRTALRFRSRDHRLAQRMLAQVGKVLIQAGKKLEQLDHQKHHSQPEAQTV